jgi:hypothetical protein
MKMQFEMKTPLARADRGPYGETYPEGTLCRAFFVESRDGSTKVDVFIYFTPDGKKFFSFITPNMSDTFLAYTAEEVNLMRAFLDWLASHTAELYPTDEHPTGLPLDDIEDCEKVTETTSKGDHYAELGE